MLTSPGSPFHAGEAAVQTRMGVRSHIERMARKFIRPYMPEQHRDFFTSQPFLVLAGRDRNDRMWSTLLCGPRDLVGFVKSPTQETLKIHAGPVEHDALFDSFVEGSEIGILGIEFETKRRNRVNGKIAQMERNEDGTLMLDFQVDQSFGNCPQYITPRKWHRSYDKSPLSASESSMSSVPICLNNDRHVSRELSNKQIAHIKQANTLFFATGFQGKGEDRRFGCDASHRGGPKGFVTVANKTTLRIPDFSGNNFYNTIGNLEMDSRMGITFPRFETGGMIQMTGNAVVEWDEEKAAEEYPGALRTIVFSIEEIVDIPDGSLPIRWNSGGQDTERKTFQVMKKVKETEEVVSFYLQPAEGENPEIWSFKPGQHLPISLEARNGNKHQLIERAYSLSCGPSWGLYRISVKREPHGTASRYLHDSVQVGDRLMVQHPAGDFVLRKEKSSGENKAIVLVSAGIGVKPMLSMLHELVQNLNPNLKLYWVHGARSSTYHVFKDEVKELARLGGASVKTHVAYSRPQLGDTGYDSHGRVDADLLAKLVEVKKADFYLCGPAGFVADVQSGLEDRGVSSTDIYAETF